MPVLSKPNPPSPTPINFQMELVESFNDGENTKNENDKIKKEEFQTVENLIYKKNNAEVRNGFSELLEISDNYGLLMHRHKDGNQLLCVRLNSAGLSKLTRIDRTTAALTDKTLAITGSGQPQGVSLRDYLYFVNGAENLIRIYDGATGYTTVTDGAFATPILSVATINGRLWACTKNLLKFSKLGSGVVSSFDATIPPLTTGLDRGGTASSTIEKMVGIVGAGKTLVLFGENNIETHSIPEIQGGLTSLDANLTTLKLEVPGYGITSKWACCIVGDSVYFAEKRGFFKMNILYGTIKKLDKNQEYHRSLNYDNCQMAYDNTNDTIYFSATDSLKNNIVQAYNIELNAFSVFPNFFIQSWAVDKQNIYFSRSTDKKVCDGFVEGLYTDVGEKINYKLLSSATDNKTIKYFKRTGRMILDFMNYGYDSIVYKFYADRIQGGTKTPSFTHTIKTLKADQGQPLGGGIGGFGISPWGMAGVDFDAIQNQEKISTNPRINTKYIRAEIELSGATSKKLMIRRLGFEWRKSRLKTKDTTFNQ